MYIPNLSKVLIKYTPIVNINDLWTHPFNYKIPDGNTSVLVYYTKTSTTNHYIRPKLGVYKIRANKPFKITVQPSLKVFESKQSKNDQNNHIISFTRKQCIENNAQVFKITRESGIENYVEFLIRKYMMYADNDGTSISNFYRSCMCWNAYGVDCGQPHLPDWKWNITTDFSSPLHISWLSPNILLKSPGVTPALKYSV